MDINNVGCDCSLGWYRDEVMDAKKSQPDYGTALHFVLSAEHIVVV